MSGITLQLLADTNASSFTQASDAWNRVATGLDTGLDEFITASQYLPAVWPTGGAAQEMVAALRAELSNTHGPCQKISRALRTHGDTILSLQSMLTDIQLECAAKGLTVDLATGVVSSKNHLADTVQAAMVAGLIRSYSGQLGEILTRANQLDLETVEALGQLPPAAGASRTGPKVTADDLATMKDKTPAQVHSWWQTLARDQQDQAIHDFPRVIGWMDGVPAVDRDKANRIGLAQHKQYLQDRLADRGLGLEAQETYDELQRLETIESGLEKLGSRGLLLDFDTSAYLGDGKVIMAMGNPDTTRHTGVWVPGMGTTLGSNTLGNLDRIIKMNDQADALTRQQDGDVSTIYWLGYDAPEVPPANLSVLLSDRSVAGRDAYVDFMQSLRATHESDIGHLVAMGHSYGTTVLGEAAATHHLPVDDIVTAGSPGMHVGSANDLMNDPRHVWAGASDSDPVPRSGALLDSGSSLVDSSPLLEFAEGRADADHGLAPSDPTFGGNSWKADTPGHTRYWDDDTESLRNQSRVLAGTYDQVTLNSGSIPENWR